MKTLTSATQAASAQTITQPGYLIELAWGTIVRLSTRGDKTWGGQAWTGGLVASLAPRDGGRLALLNTDNGFSALLMNNTVADIGCRIWQFYGDTLGEDDPFLIFDGVIDGVDELTRTTATLTLAAEHARTLHSPRRRIGATTGFTRLTPAGTRLTWAGQTITLERAA